MTELQAHDDTATRSESSGWSARTTGLLTSPHASTFIALLAGLWALPALRLGLQSDDQNFSFIVRHGGSPFGLFELTPDMIRKSLQQGSLPWWTNPDFKLSFFRPLSSLSHYLDYLLWPQAAWLMHFWNVALYAATVYVAARLYRELLPDALTAGLATALFAIDDAHGHAIGWISSRNTIIGTLCALLALLAHHRAQRWQSAGWVALALCAGETGLASACYLTAYACTLDTGTPRARVTRLLPQLLVLLLWTGWYTTHHYGVYGTGMYRELNPPWNLLLQGVLDLPLWLCSLFGPSLISLALVTQPNGPRLMALILVLPLLAALAWRLTPSPTHKFFAVLTALCLPPLFTTSPQDRVTFAAGFGAFALLASFIRTATRRAGAPRFARICRGVFIVFHGVLAGLLFQSALAAFQPIQRGSQALSDQLHDAPGHSTVLVNAPFSLLPLYAAMTYGNEHGSLPQSMLMLYAGNSAAEVVRVDDRTLDMTVARGWGELMFDRVFSDRAHLPQSGEKRTVSDAQIEVLASDRSGLPTHVRFQFATALAQPERHWLVWAGTRPVPWTLPRVGETVTLPALSFVGSLPR